MTTVATIEPGTLTDGMTLEQWTERKHACRRKPPPSGFAETFIRWGWRGVETVFGAHTRCNKRWVCECGGQKLKAERLWYRQRLRQVRMAA